MERQPNRKMATKMEGNQQHFFGKSTDVKTVYNKSYGTDLDDCRALGLFVFKKTQKSSPWRRRKKNKSTPVGEPKIETLVGEKKGMDRPCVFLEARDNVDGMQQHLFV